jgi:hypothetical protein
MVAESRRALAAAAGQGERLRRRLQQLRQLWKFDAGFEGNRSAAEFRAEEVTFLC